MLWRDTNCFILLTNDRLEALGTTSRQTACVLAHVHKAMQTLNKRSVFPYNIFRTNNGPK